MLLHVSILFFYYFQKPDSDSGGDSGVGDLSVSVTDNNNVKLCLVRIFEVYTTCHIYMLYMSYSCVQQHIVITVSSIQMLFSGALYCHK